MRNEITLYRSEFNDNDGMSVGDVTISRTYDEAYLSLPDGDGRSGVQTIEKLKFEFNTEKIIKEHDLEGYTYAEVLDFVFENGLVDSEPTDFERVFQEKVLSESEKIDKENEGTDDLIVEVQNELSKRFDDNVDKYTTLYVDDDGYITTDEDSRISKLIRIADHTHNDRRPVDLDVVISNVDATKMKFVESHRNVLRFNGTATVDEIVEEILDYKFRL